MSQCAACNAQAISSARAASAAFAALRAATEPEKKHHGPAPAAVTALFAASHKAPLHPTATLDLCHTVATTAGEVLELNETVVNSGAKTLFGKTTQNRLTLRLSGAPAALRLQALVVAASS